MFGSAEVSLAIVAGHELRYAYVNQSYRAIRADTRMVGRTYRDVFPEAADEGAEANLRRVIRSGESWIIDDYPTPLPNRDVPAWWQGECVPISLHGEEIDAVLILIWDVSHRYLGAARERMPSRERLRVESAKAKLMAQMVTLGLTPRDGWSVTEEVREATRGTLWILRPVHLRKGAPPLEERVLFPDAAETGD